MLTVVHLVPTGVGAAIGGFAGDAGPATRLLAAACDRLVTHPNVANAANLLSLPPNALYVEGRALDDWLAGRWALRPGVRQRVGLVVDAAVADLPLGTLEATLNAANAVRAVHGVELVGYQLTERPLGCRLTMDARGVTHGEVAHPEALLAAARVLAAAGATAIAIAADLGEPDPATERAYREGRGVDPIGGLEAILSHLVVSELGIPAAHAPLMSFDPVPPPIVDARAAAEYLGHTFLPCILQGLAAHPALVRPETRRLDDLMGADVAAVIAPAGCLGGPGVLAALSGRIPVIAVAENTSVLAVTAEALGVEDAVWPAANYLEAAGLVASLRAGIDWRAVRRPMAVLKQAGVSNTLKSS